MQSNSTRSSVKSANESVSSMTELPERLHSGHGDHANVGWLAFASLGVVYGDIGTSVLYAIKECFASHGGHPPFEPNEVNVLGILSLVIWAITLVVSIKHIVFVMRADNNGEGGTMALLSLITPRFSTGSEQKKSTKLIMLIGLVGASLFAADGTITPAISVLSAVEGLEIATPAFKPFVIPLTVAIIIAIFMAQRRGTEAIAKFFAPTMMLWFFVIAVVAIPSILIHPGVLAAFNPVWAYKFLASNGWNGFFVLGSVVLVITGGEALYADMGHFGRKAIRIAWFPVVMPALMINYLGQGALILEKGDAVLKNPFFAMVDGWMIYPMVLLACMATVIASQALISGSFSLAQQAIQLGFSPRLTVVHTSGETKGQIYIPEVNHLLMVICVLLVLMFKESSALAAAYGISVMGTMIITSSLMFVLAWRRWGWPMWQAMVMTGLFWAVEIPFLGANLHKIVDGGWFPLVLSAVAFTVMTTWKRGRGSMVRRMQMRFFPVREFVEKLAEREVKVARVPGTAIFMTPNPKVTPPALSHHVKHNQVLHEQVLLLAIVTEDVPVVATKDILEVNSFGEGLYELTAHYGFMQTPKVGRILRLARAQYGIATEEDSTTYYLGRDILLTNGNERMMRWRKTLFAFLSRNSLSATAYFGIPPDRVIEMGMQVEL
ncbi:MAG: potassium transporter Kup [Proteobacteria bacterium]|nr:potassium transporter Kup [Pseudomonadota bacterium]